MSTIMYLFTIDMLIEVEEITQNTNIHIQLHFNNFYTQKMSSNSITFSLLHLSFSPLKSKWTNASGKEIRMQQ